MVNLNLNLKKLVKERYGEAKKRYVENKDFKKRVGEKIKSAKRKAFEKQIVIEARKSGKAVAKKHFAPKQPVAVGMFNSNLVRQPQLSKPKKKGKQKPQRPFDPFKDLIQ